MAGMRLWIGNIAPEATDDDLRALLDKYGAVTVEAMERVPGDGSRPAAIIDIVATSEQMYKVTQRLNGMHWKGRSLTVQAMTR
jgi:RNA recognition motif-containing protein